LRTHLALFPQVARLCKAAALLLVSLHARKEAADLQTQALILEYTADKQQQQPRSQRHKHPRHGSTAGLSIETASEGLIRRMQEYGNRATGLEVKAAQKAQVSTAASAQT